MNAVTQDTLQIDVETLDRLRRAAAPLVLLDVREPWEREICAIEPSLGIPLGALPDRLQDVPTGGLVVVLCHHGVRSFQAMSWLRRHGFPTALNLDGGIDAWADRIDKTMARY